MRLLKLQISAFQCIQSADIELGPGLNVLFGPNDHGKSTLASAIRSGLLLQHSSTAVEKHVSWHTGEMPQVQLSFTTESQRFWRVRKVFGKGGSSTLEASKDGVSYSKDTDARQVDDRVRELLGWGIAKPGGSGAGKGLPESFLANVLLPEQSDVIGVFERSLDQDKDESGRARVSQALQALAQEPLLKKVLDRAKAKVARAYTGSGKFSKGKGSPLQEISSQITELRKQHDELQRRIDEANTAESTLGAIQECLTTLAFELEHRQQELEQAEKFSGLRQKQQSAHERLLRLQEELDAIQSQVTILQDTELRLGHLDQERAQLQLQEQHAQQAVQAARQSLAEATAESGAQERELRRQQLENELLQLQKRLSDSRGRLHQAQQARILEEEALQSGKSLLTVRTELDQVEAALATLQQEKLQALEGERNWRQLHQFAWLREAEKQLESARLAAVQAEELAARAASLRGQAEDLGAQDNLPAKSEVDRLQQQFHELEKAEARLGGGLSLRFTPKSGFSLDYALDGQASQNHSGQEPLEVEALRTIQLLSDAFEMQISAGEAEARQKVEQLRQDWASTGGQVLAATGLLDLAALKEARQQADVRLREAEQLRQQASECERASQERRLRAQGQSDCELRVSQRSQELGSFDRQQMEQHLAALGASWEGELASRLQTAEKERERVSEILRQRENDKSGLQARLVSEAAADERLQQKWVALAAGYEQGLSTILNELPENIRTLEKLEAERKAELEALSSQANQQVESARQQLATATEILEGLTARRGPLEQQRQELAQLQARTAGVVEQLQKQAQSQDIEAARVHLQELEAQLAACGQADLDECRRALTGALQAYQEKEKELNVARGRLSSVDGDVAREQKRDIDQALEQAEDQERQITVEYGAWKLLAETLREVENSHGAHLGKALAGTLSSRLSQLSAGRYGGLELDAHLKGGGLGAAGKLRPFDVLSEGTKDQVATLFRLGIAEQLGTALVLDDHLNQSDPQKIGWFLEHLRETGEKIQILLITCRPDDYLRETERPEEGQVFRDLGERMRCVDLSRAIRRYPLVAVD